MEQKSMFKRLLSFVVIFTMLFSSFVVLAAPAFAADEAADAGKYNAGLNIELSDNEQLLNIDDAAAIKLLTDGDWALNAEAWGGNTNGVVLVQNKNATQQNAWGQANFIWKFEDTPDPYNSIKFGFYSDVNSMIGYPTEEDVWFSNNGVDWVSGYSSSDIGYGETIPDAMTKFDGEATPAGTVIGEIKLRNPQTYKYVKIELYYPKSPFTEENGYVDGTAKPRWEFFGLTEVFDFDLVPTSTVVTDWNAHQYWEGRGGSNGSYAFNNAEDYAASSLTWWKHVAFAPVEGKENTYTIAGIREAGENPLLAFPEGGFVWCAWGDASAGTPGKAALNLFGTMTEGDIYVLTGFDVAGEFVQNDATITKWVDPDAPANVALGSKYEIVGLAPSSSYPDTANKELTDGARVNGKYNEPGWVGVILTGTVRAFDVVVTLGDGETVYNIDKIIVNAGAKGATCGVTEPNFITYYSVDGETWTEFGTYTATDNADVMSVNATMEVATPVAAKYIKVNVSRPKGIGNLMWLGEIEAYGVEASAEEKYFWEEGEYELDASGNWNPYYAWNYVFEIDTFNSTTGAATAIFDNATDYAAKGPGKWTTQILLAPVAGQEGVYEVIAAYKTTGKNAQANLDDGTIDFNDGKIVLSVQDSGTRPEKNDDGTLKFPNWEDRAASWGLLNTLRAKVTLEGSTLTVEDKPNPVISGWGADVTVMTDGYTGLGEITGWEGNQTKIYGFSNNLLVKAEYDFTIAIEETEFDAITLYALDYANGGVFVPTSVKFVVGENTYDAVITANENGIATITAELTEAVTASEIKVLAVMGASPYSFAIFNMFTELEVREYVEPVGTKENPAVIEIMPGMRGYMGEGYATLKGGDEYYFTAIVPVDGNVNANFYVIDAEYNGYSVLYSLNGGELLDNYNYDNPGLDNLKAGDVVTVYVKVSDETPDVDLTAMISLDAVGSMSNPEEIEAGEYTAEIGAGNWSGYNYEFVAEKDGYVKVTIADDNAGWVYSLSNVSAGIYGDMHYSDDETVVKADYVKVAAGETATINVSTYGGATTEGTVKFTVSFIPYVESFWTEEEDGRTAPDSNYNPAHAWGYEFDIAAVDPTALIGEANVIITNFDTYKVCGGNFKYVAHAFFKPTGVEGEYVLVREVNYFGKKLNAIITEGLVTEADFADGTIVLISASAASKPLFLEDGSLQYANWEQKVAVWALGKTIGAKATLGENTLTIEDKPVGKITQWTGGADISVLTDGYTGVGEVTGYEGNGDKLYGLGNDILFETEYSFDVSLGYTAFDSITLYALDYANGGVMLPKSVEFVVNGESYEGTITANENGIATITADLWTEVRASSITVNAVMGASPYTFPIFNMFTELAVNEIEYTTSKVVTDFNPVSYKQSFGGANGAFIYDDPNVYATAGIDWWIHVLFAPTEMDGIYEVKAVRAPQAGNYLTLEWGNFVWAAWSSAGDTPDSAGAFALDFMGKLSVGDKVEFTGVDFFMQTTEADATAEKWIDPNAPVNVALNKTYEISGIGNRDSYYGNVTDGIAVMNLGNNKNAEWFGFYNNGNYPTNAPDKVGYFIIDLEKAYDVNNIRVGLIKNESWGIVAPASVKAYGSLDGEEFAEIGTFAYDLTDGVGVWTEITAEATARYIKIEVTLAGTFAFVNEVEVYGEEAEIPVAKDKLTIELSDNDTILGKTTDEAIDLLTDGDWVLNAGAWGTGTENVVLFQNKNATDSGAYGQINIIYEFAETPEPYNNIKLGLYSDVNSMIGYPSEEDIFFSNDGINWVGGYSNASIGYGETIPDAMTKFDGEATPAGTVIAELKLRVPQTYKFVKIEFYFPKSPFTVDNGYAPEAAKPRWEFFGVTEYEIGYVEPSSVITDFNITEYWESRYGRGCGSFAFTTADDYKVAWDNFITSSYTQVAFAPVAGVENTYEVVVIGNSELTFPEGGFIWTAYNSATADSPAEAAINLFKSMTVGEQYTFSGIDFEKEYGEKDASVTKYEAPVVDEGVTVVPNYNFKYAAGNTTILVPWTMGTTLESILDKQYEWFNFAVLAWDAEAGVYKVADVKLGTNIKASADPENGSDFGGLEIPEYGFILGAHSDDTVNHEAIEALKVGDVVYIYGTDLTNATQETALTDAVVTTKAIEGKDAFAPEIVVVPEKPVISVWGSGGTIDVLTDGYTGVGEVTKWEGNEAKLYGLSNNLLVKAEYDFVIAITETKFDAITLYALDYANGGVMLPESVKFVVGDKTYDAVITANENGIATITAELGEAVTASEIKVLVVMGASPYTFPIFNMFTELEVNKVEDPKPTALLGDVNGNGEIEMYDYILIKRHIMGTFVIGE